MKDKTPSINHRQYLELERILSSQHPQSEKTGKPVHDEMLFIILQQIGELWFKQIIHETNSVLAIFKNPKVHEGDLGVVTARLDRVGKILENLIDQVRILETMAPLDFLEFRDLLTTASGIQSEQYWSMCQKLGVQQLDPTWGPKSEKDHLSLFDVVEAWLERTPFLQFKGFDFWKTYQTTVENILKRDEASLQESTLLPEQRNTMLREIENTRASFEAILSPEKHHALREAKKRRLSHRATQAALLIYLYRDEPILQLPYKLLTQLVDIDDLLSTWRHQHATLVKRMIGTKLGSYQTSGHTYLQSTVDSRRVFSDIANLSTFLVSRSALPPLPSEVKRSLDFVYSTEQK